MYEQSFEHPSDPKETVRAFTGVGILETLQYYADHPEEITRLKVARSLIDGEGRMEQLNALAAQVAAGEIDYTTRDEIARRLGLEP